MDRSIEALPTPAWQEACLRKLSRQAPPPGLLLRGHPGIGKKRLALDLARAWLAGDNPNARALFDSGNHPDFLSVEPQPRPDGTASAGILIEQIRELPSFAMHSPALSSRRIALVYPACQMNRNAANALLKLLEEPPPSSSLILAAHDPSRLPATILSRCQIVKAPAPSAEQTREWLDAAGMRPPEIAMQIYGRAPYKLAAMDNLAALEKLVGFLRNPEQAAFGETAGMLAKARAADWMDWMLKWANDMAGMSFGISPRYFSGCDDDLKRIASDASQLAWLNFQEEIAELNAQAQASLNVQLLAEKVLGAYLLCRSAT